VKKGVSETFDEHEQDTARRAYSRELVEGAKRTTQMQKFDPEAALRTESGTRPALNPDAIERHVRERMEDAISAVERVSGTEADPHSRPTIEAGVFKAIQADNDGAEWSPPPMAAPSAAALSAITPVPVPAPPVPHASVRPASVPAWAIAVAVSGVLFLISAAGTVGFFLGRRTAHR
jgi:hypothetical protein